MSRSATSRRPRKPAKRARVMLACVGSLVGLVALGSACGSRTALFDGEGNDDTTTLPDGGHVFETGVLDQTSPPPFDGDLPPIDAVAPLDANRNDCPDADATLVYVVTGSTGLYSYYPTDGSFTFIANIACPSNPGETPFSMAVDRTGIAYVAYSDGNLYRVSTANGACTPTGYVPPATGEPFNTFGMGFATNAGGPSETLYVASSTGGDLLGKINTMSFARSTIGVFDPDINEAELTGTGDGRLFAFYNKNGNGNGTGNPPPSFIGEIDTSSAKVIAETAFPTVGQGSGWAFAFWGGDFFMFTSTDATTSDITRYRPADGTTTVVGSLPSVIVGAGVSTCAPSE